MTNKKKNDYKEYDYLITLEKDYEKNTKEKVNVQYSIIEGDMDSVKHLEVNPVSLKGKLTSV